MPSKSPKSLSTPRNIKLVLEYDGSRFFGFQRQNEKPTIQSELEKALSRLFNRSMKIQAASGRTDSGVHAAGQVVNFKTGSSLRLEKIQAGLNALLPSEIAVKKIEEAPLDFHARYDARWKTYEYLVFNSKTRSPLVNGRAYRFPYPLEIQKMRKAARHLKGRHNFKAFQASGSSVKKSVRSIRRFTVEKKNVWVRFTVEADGFLYHMVRNLVGTLLEVGRGRMTDKEFMKVLKSRKRFLAGPTAPAHGLTLSRVDYSAPKVRLQSKRHFGILPALL